MTQEPLGATATAHVRKVVKPKWVSVLVVLVGWQVTSLFFSPTVFPSLGRLAEGLYVVLSGTSRFQPVNHIPWTVARMVLGFVVATLSGIVFGFAMGVREYFERHLLTVMLILLAVPAIVWAFILVIWLGLTTLAVPVVTIALVIVPYVTIHVWEGTKAVDPQLVEMAETFGADRRQVFTEIYLPQLSPYLFSTVEAAFAISWKIVLIGELFGTTRGVGFAINYYFNREAIGMVIAWALPVMFLVYAFDVVLTRIERRFFAWRQDFAITGDIVE